MTARWLDGVTVLLAILLGGGTFAIPAILVALMAVVTAKLGRLGGLNNSPLKLGHYLASEWRIVAEVGVGLGIGRRGDRRFYRKRNAGIKAREDLASDYLGQRVPIWLTAGDAHKELTHLAIKESTLVDGGILGQRGNPSSE